MGSHKYNFSQQQHTLRDANFADMKNQQAQRRIIAAALFPTINADPLLTAYQQQLADQYVQGALTIQRAVALLKEHQQLLAPTC